jgi:hypothetical protein
MVLMNNNKQKRNMMAIFTAVIVVVIGLVGLLIRDNAIQNEKLAQNLIDGFDKEALRVTLERAKTAYDTGEALFVDVRSLGEFESSRIPDSILIPVGGIKGNEPNVPKDTLIFTYCT